MQNPFATIKNHSTKYHQDICLTSYIKVVVHKRTVSFGLSSKLMCNFEEIHGQKNNWNASRSNFSQTIRDFVIFFLNSF